jgi:hypothetical protein
LGDYDHVTADILNSKSATFETNLDRWFEHLSESLTVDRIVRDLESTVDFEKWRKEREATAGSFVGGGRLAWPTGTQRIAMQLAVFRAMSDKKYSYSDFDHTFFGNTRYDDMVFEITRQVFNPMSRDLRKYLVKVARAPADQPSTDVPASDRTVRLDHNNPKYQTIRSDLEKLRNDLRGVNDYPDETDKQQRVAEIEAAQTLLSAPRARVDALISVVYRGLKYIAKKFADTTIGLLATGLLTLIGAWLAGLW